MMNNSAVDIDDLLDSIGAEALKPSRPEVVDIDDLLDEEDTEEQPDSQTSDESIRWGRFLGERLAQGALSLADLAKIIAFLPVKIANKFDMRDYYGNKYKEPENPSSFINRKAREAGVDLESQGKGNTPTQRMIGSAIHSLPAARLPGARLVKGAMYASGMGAASQGLQEMGVNPIAAELATLVGAVGASKLNRAFRGATGMALNNEEKKISKILKNTLDKEVLPSVTERLSPLKNIPFETIAYEPMTAEIAQSPALSQIHRARSIMPGSGLSHRSSLQNAALSDALERESVKALSSDEIKQSLANELKAREVARRNATKGGYKAVEEMSDSLKPESLRDFLENKPAAGTIKQSLGAIKKEIKGKNSIAELVALDQHLTDKIKSIRRLGETKHSNVLRQAQEKLREDLDKIDLYKNTRSDYARLSEPVSEITEHKGLKNILKSRNNEVINQVFDNKSADNVKQLKKVFFKEDPKLWSEFKDSTTKYLMDSITNAGMEGRGHVFSYAKMKNFMNKHREAIHHVYDKDQIKFINEFQRAIKGQNAAKTLGASPGSDTAAKLAINNMLKPGVISKSIGFLPKPKGMGDVLKWYSKNREDELLSVLDKVLLEPEYAHKLMTTPFKDFEQASNFMRAAVQRSPGVITKTFKNEINEPEEDIQDIEEFLGR